MLAAIEKTEPPPFTREEEPLVTAPSPLATPSCPRCGAQMKIRVARQGVNKGKEFWGCSDFPKCNGTRLLEDTAVLEPTAL